MNYRQTHTWIIWHNNKNTNIVKTNNERWCVSPLFSMLGLGLQGYFIFLFGLKTTFSRRRSLI